jgi:hypothetical protein
VERSSLTDAHTLITFFQNGLNFALIKVKRNTSTVIGNYEDGGLKMPHVLSFVHALKISWIKRVLDPDNYAPWKVTVTFPINDIFLKDQSPSNLCICSIF